MNSMNGYEMSTPINSLKNNNMSNLVKNVENNIESLKNTNIPSSQPMHQYFIGSTYGIKGRQVEEESFFLKKRANFNMLECFLI